MFDTLTDKLGSVLNKLTRRGALTEADVQAAMREVRVALLEADVALSVVKDFIANCPDIAVVDTREGTNYVAILAAADRDFAEAWSRYHQIAAFDGLRVLKRDAAGCTAPPKRAKRLMQVSDAGIWMP